MVSSIKMKQLLVNLLPLGKKRDADNMSSLRGD